MPNQSTYKTREERLWSGIIIDPNSGCWLWTKHVDACGYGRMGFEGKVVSVHRFSYETFVGKIPIGLEIDHKCRTRCCARPDHLEPVTHLENVRRGDAKLKGLHNKNKAYCKFGHQYNEENTGQNENGSRYCRICCRLRRRKHLAEINKGRHVKERPFRRKFP